MVPLIGFLLDLREFSCARARLESLFCAAAGIAAMNVRQQEWQEEVVPRVFSRFTPECCLVFHRQRFLGIVFNDALQAAELGAIVQ